MCMEDIKLGRETVANVRVVASGIATVTQLCGIDTHRTRLILSSNGVGTFYVMPKGIPPADLTGFVINPSMPILDINIEQYGQLVTFDWSVFILLVGGNITVAELTLQREK